MESPRGRFLFDGDDAPDDVSTVAQGAMVVESSPPPLTVVVLEGPDAGKSFRLDPNAPTRILVGSSPVCQIRLSDPTVSRRHAAFEPAGAKFRLVDLQSRNGTYVDGVGALDVYVRGGEVVRCGSTAMRIDVESESAPPPSTAFSVSNATSFGLLHGASLAMRRLYPLCDRLARTRVPVIIEGETGTGKEVLAESLHEVGNPGKPFVVFDCTTVSPSLVESELFGHERGAFTGAVGSRAGVFEEADGGTLLIDEIGDLDLPLQAKLLRVIDRQELRRVGGQKTIKVNVRVLAATRRDLDKAVAAGQFRDDLFHRLAVARIELPPLRERAGDIPLLVRRFANELGGSPDAVPPEVVARFSEYSWPGNVRELRNSVARYIAVGESTVASQQDAGGAQFDGGGEARMASASIPPGADPGLTDDEYNLPFALARRRALANFERAYVERVLAAHGGNVSKAARSSGLALRYFRLVKARMKQPRGE
jgi:transcriptional regulator with GAF, ATPase, and Fis domain